MNYLLIEPKQKAIAPNIALMKWARWCEINGHQYQYIRGLVKPDMVPDRILISCIFIFDAKLIENTIDILSNRFPGVPINVGGVFPSLYPKWFEKDKWSGDPWYGGTKVSVHSGMCDEIENLPPQYDLNIKGNEYSLDKIVLYASRGCVNKCAYCAVPRLEGKMKSFKSIKHMLPKNKEDFKSIVLYDNNFTEHEYFDNIVDELIEYGLPVDIHGLHVQSFTEHHAKRFAELKWVSQGKGPAYLRFSFDKLKYADDIERVTELVKRYKIGAQMFCYMLYNFNDSPDDFLYRIYKTKEIVDRVGKTIFLFPTGVCSIQP
jgi:hypothetical protein